MEQGGDGMLDYEELLALASRKERRGSASGILSKLKEKVGNDERPCLVYQ